MKSIGKIIAGILLILIFFQSVEKGYVNVTGIFRVTMQMVANIFKGVVSPPEWDQPVKPGNKPGEAPQ